MKIGIIGGSGVYDMAGFTRARSVEKDTPFGAPSDALMEGEIGGRAVVFLPRHGRGHRWLPGEINHRANIYAMKQAGVEQVISISAVGSLREEYRPRDIVLPDQYFDRTKKSLEHTFFGSGMVAHIGFSDPTCPALRSHMARIANEVIGALEDPVRMPRVHDGGLYVNMEGPAFSTKAESHIYRQLGCDVIGMTSLPEAKLCREAEICYQAMAMVTDYDCWRESEGMVSVDMIMEHLQANTELAKSIVQRLAPALPDERECDCAQALSQAILTPRDQVPAETLARLQPIVGKHFSA